MLTNARLFELRGVEGDSARTYFSAFNDMIIQHKNDFVFHLGRDLHWIM